MRAPVKFLMLLATMAIGVTPEVAVAAGTGGQPTNRPATHTSSPNPGHGAKANAYGKLCQDQSKKHVAGSRGTPFSKCVTDMAKLARGSSTSPRAACQNESKKHIAGTPGTPFSHCVSSGAKLLKTQHHAH